MHWSDHTYQANKALGAKLVLLRPQTESFIRETNGRRTSVGLEETLFTLSELQPEHQTEMMMSECGSVGLFSPDVYLFSSQVSPGLISWGTLGDLIGWGTFTLSFHTTCCLRL